MIWGTSLLPQAVLISSIKPILNNFSLRSVFTKKIIAKIFLNNFFSLIHHTMVQNYSLKTLVDINL